MSLSTDVTSGSSRRNFLKECGMAIVAGSLGGYLTDAEGAVRPAEPLILGAGNHRYEWVRGWGTLPAGMNFGSTHGAVQLDALGRVYFNTDTENAIIVFDANGKFIKSMAKEEPTGWSSAARVVRSSST